MIVGVIGSRNFNGYEKVVEELDRLAQSTGEPITELVSGGAKNSADTLAERYAEERGIPMRVFLPDYAAYGRAAPLIRNKSIIDACTVLIAFWDSKSRGTAHALRLARRRKPALRLIIVVPLP
ncbi:DUF2493 domain-containing protein [Hymenobacter sp. BT175]|uniref:DUF2493 domain-containing protein n=1 Tax=Hymenobacter translucens TaxID=2886507 RepID=UPI001D0EA541|nr:DUF2493 domain-containing protein [Hymenobacter translucens]MCC2545488.1 DUF2493 domain-containing protein [Hymenobacter translucens]